MFILLIFNDRPLEDTFREMIFYVHEEECLSDTSSSLKANIIYMKKLHGYKECYTIFE